MALIGHHLLIILILSTVVSSYRLTNNTDPSSPSPRSTSTAFDFNREDGDSMPQEESRVAPQSLADKTIIKEITEGHHHSTHEPHMSLVGWRWSEVEAYLVISIFFLSAAMVKIAYHHLDIIHAHVPESCVLIILGTIIGTIYHYGDFQEHLPFQSSHFFFLLLPPIILESAYSLHDKAFFYNIKTILLYAIFGTLINVFLIGGSLYGLNSFGVFSEFDINLIECFTFSTIISAVDPVAVLAIFHEIGVNKSLYFLVFRESLLNDAVVIVLYSTVTTFAALPIITAKDIVVGILSFFSVSGGGLIIGIIVGSLTALITKTTETIRVVEPFVVIILAYMSYVVAELFHFSGIISLIACGLVQYEYIADNIATDSLTTIKYFTKTMSSISDVIIFFYLGRVLVRDDHTWSSSFVFFSTIFCVIFRFVSIFSLTVIANKWMQHHRRINFGEQFLMAYGGLRGAIAFSLAVSLNSNVIVNSKLFVTTSLFIILFTVFFLGSTTKPVIRWLNVKLQHEEKKSMFIEINDRVVDTIMSGIAEISGVDSVHSLTLKFNRINENLLKRFFTRGNMHSFKHTFEQVRWSSVRRSRKFLHHHHRRFSNDPKVQGGQMCIDIDISNKMVTMSPFDEEDEEVFINDVPVVRDTMPNRSRRRTRTESLKQEARPGSPRSSSPRRSKPNSRPSSQPNSRPGSRSGSPTSSRRYTRRIPSTRGVGRQPPQLPVYHYAHHSNFDQFRHRRRSTMSSRRVVNSMFSQSSFYHLPRRDSIEPTSASPITTPIDLIPPSSARTIFSFFPPMPPTSMSPRSSIVPNVPTTSTTAPTSPTCPSPPPSSITSGNSNNQRTNINNLNSPPSCTSQPLTSPRPTSSPSNDSSPSHVNEETLQTAL